MWNTSLMMRLLFLKLFGDSLSTVDVLCNTKVEKIEVTDFKRNEHDFKCPLAEKDE